MNHNDVRLQIRLAFGERRRALFANWLEVHNRQPLALAEFWIERIQEANDAEAAAIRSVDPLYFL